MNENIAFGIIISSLFVLLIVLFATIMIKLSIAKIKNYTKIIYEKDIAFQKALTSTIIETQELVLNNISQDLHDDAGQQLTYINFQIESLKLDSTELDNTLTPLSQSITKLAQTVRNIGLSLNNQLLLQQDLIRAIETEASRINESDKIKIKINPISGLPKDFSANEKIVIYRIFQEIINNALKHSNATIIDLWINFNPKIEITFADNGKGFDYEEYKKNALTLGLINMTERASIIDYTLEICSAIGKGTTIKLSKN